LNIQTITIVGCGGTGSVIVRSVARMVYDLKMARRHVPQIIIIDHDTVEKKNVGRQLYTEGDVGQPKAVVLMRRFNCALGLDISAIPEPVNAEKHFERYSGGLVIGAVDNHLARRELAKIKNTCLIDIGNHHASAQVVIGNTADRELMLRHLDGDNGKYRYLPNFALLFPSLLEPEPEQPPQPLSCADLTAAGTQHLLINDWAATVAAGYVYRLLHREPIHSFVSYISADTLSVRSLPICRDELLPYLHMSAV
jgi:PRTRC genetic system ThiF family protein